MKKAVFCRCFLLISDRERRCKFEEKDAGGNSADTVADGAGGRDVCRNDYGDRTPVTGQWTKNRDAQDHYSQCKCAEAEIMEKIKGKGKGDTGC